MGEVACYVDGSGTTGSGKVYLMLVSLPWTLKRNYVKSKCKITHFVFFSKK